MNNKTKLGIFVLHLSIFCLSSCSLLKCEAKGKVIVKYPSIYLGEDRFINEKIKQIKSPKSIASVKEKLNKNKNYRVYLSDDNFAKHFQVKKLDGTDILNFSYQHSDSNFAKEVVNIWMNVAFWETSTVYTPKVLNLEQKYKSISDAVLSERTIDAAYEIFNIIKNGDLNIDNLSKKDFAIGFNIEKDKDNHTITVTYQNSDIELANKAMDAWFHAMLSFINRVEPLSNINYDRDNFNYKDFEKFSFDRSKGDRGIKEIEISIKDERITYIKILEKANTDCIWQRTR